MRDPARPIDAADRRRRAVVDSTPRPATQLPPHLELIGESHQRCAALGLSRIERPDHAPLARSDLSVARERNQRLFAHAAPVMEMLFEQIAGTDSMIVLTDAHGTILYSVGDDDFLDRAGKVALAPGVSWAEHSKGTNAIGTALFAEAPTLVHADEHFMHANSFLTCSAAPIFDPRGSMLGVLDVSGDHRSYHQHTMGLVRMSARMIENQWLSDDYSHRLRLHFHSRVEFIGTLLEGIVVVGADGRILGANRSGLDQIGLTSAQLRLQTLASLFDSSAAALFDHFRAPLAPPLLLRLPDGRQLYAHARFNGPARPVAIGLQPQLLGATEGSAAEPRGLAALLTGDPGFDALIRKAERIVDRDIALLIVGEAGAGKEVLARAIHHGSRRARQPFVAVHCAALPAAQLEAELLGAARRVAQPGGGTLFLDQVGELPLPLQGRLAQLLDDRCVIASNRHDLRDAVAAGRFREDLYLRLAGLTLRMPALRERSDLAVLAAAVLREGTTAPATAPQLGPTLLQLLRGYHWPGNLRQLASVLRTALAMAGGDALITEAHLSEDFADAARQATGVPAPPPPPAQVSTPPCTLEQAEIDTIRRTLDAAKGNVSLAARQLGISRNTIYRKLR